MMEALSAGIPMLAKNVGGINEVTDNSVGYLVDADIPPEKVAQIIDRNAMLAPEAGEFYESTRGTVQMKVVELLALTQISPSACLEEFVDHDRRLRRG